MSDSKVMGNEDRLKKSAAPDVRADRETQDFARTQEDGTSMTMEERIRMIRSEWHQEVLPTPPAKPGWHYCWLSTTNSSDPIYKRMQKGYEPVKATEIPGFHQFRVQEGDFEGCIACNEMLLFKIPEELYQEVMKYFHHELPMGEEEMLKANLDLGEQDSEGNRLGHREGFDTLARPARTPTFG